MDIKLQLESENVYYLKKMEEIIRPSSTFDEEINLKDPSTFLYALTKLIELYLCPICIGILYLNVTKYITNKIIKVIDIQNKNLEFLNKYYTSKLELDMEVVFNYLYELPYASQKEIIARENIDDLIKIQLFESVKRNDYSLFYKLIIDNKVNISNFLLPIQIIIQLEKLVCFINDIQSTEDLELLDNFLNKVGVTNLPNNNKDIIISIFKIIYMLYSIIKEVLNKNVLSQSEVDLIARKLNDPFFKKMFDNESDDMLFLENCEYLLTINYSESELAILYSDDILKKRNLIEKKINEKSILIQSFSLPNNYFDLPPEKDESLYLGAKDNAIITTEGVDSFNKLINFIVENNYVKTGEEHNTLNDLKYDLAFKLTGKMRPNILCAKIIWTKSDYTSPLVAIAKGLGGNYNKLKDLFIIDSSSHNRLASIYAERLRADDKFTNFFYELYPKMKKVNKPTKNNAAN